MLYLCGVVDRAWVGRVKNLLGLPVGESDLEVPFWNLTT